MFYVQLYGSRLIVEDGAILKGQGITVTKVANATIATLSLLALAALAARRRRR